MSAGRSIFISLADIQQLNGCDLTMVTITFSDRETERRGLALLLGRFSGHVLRSGEHAVPEAALEALADQRIPFSVKGRANFEQQMAALRAAALQ